MKILFENMHKANKKSFLHERGSEFVIGYYFIGWSNIQFGIHIDLFSRNFQLYLPGGFLHIGLEISSFTTKK